METSATQSLITPDTEIVLVPKRPRNRIWEIDFLRGFCIILMILDHLMMLLALFFGPAWFGDGRHITATGGGADFCRWCVEFYNSDTHATLHTIVLFVFFSISGISCTFSRSNLRRGCILAFVALLYSLVTYALESIVPGILVTFGVLHFYAVCILLYALVSFLCRRNALAVSIVSAAIIIVVACLYFLYTPPADTPTWLFFVFPPENYYGVPAGFYTAAATSPGDLFTLIPWAAFFFTGTMIAPVLYARKYSLLPFLDGKWHKPVCFVGKYAIFFYLAHVVVLTGLLMLISCLFVSPGDWVLL